MQISVNLQESFWDIIYLLIIITIVITAITIYLILGRKKDKKVENVTQIKPVTNKRVIKNRYIVKLHQLQGRIKDNEIDIRNAYQELSKTIRYFVFEMTGIKVQNFTLEEIEKLNIPLLYELIQEYYTPEFSEKSLGDIMSSIDRARKVIEKWS